MSSAATNSSSSESTQGSIDGEVVREVHLKISPQFATISVTPKEDGEGNDRNFPRNLHNAAELFLRVGMVDNAERLKECGDKLISLYEDNPDGKTGIRVGQACVCWSCGYCGLPKGYQNLYGNNNKQKEIIKFPPGPCFNCNETDQINWLQVTEKQGKKVIEIPWIETATLTEEEEKKKQDAELAAKRAEVEAQVKKALAERVKGNN